MADVLRNKFKFMFAGLLNVCGTASSAGDNAIIAAPAAGTRIVITKYVIQNESATATTMLLKDGATAFRRILAQNQGDGLAEKFSSDEYKRLAAATALNFNLSGANSCGYSVDYFIEAV